MNFSLKQKLKPELNITPLIDVVLMLLIFFMISTSFIFQPGILIKLPTATHSDASSPGGAQLLITADGELYFEQLRTSYDELEGRMKHHPDKSLLLIKADQAVSHGDVVRTMNFAKRSGFQRLAIATRPKQGT